MRVHIFKLKKKDWVQIIFPVLALIMLIQHVAVSFIITKIFPGEETYELVFAAIHAAPDDYLSNTLLFSFMTIFIWFHGVIGIDSVPKNLNEWKIYKLENSDFIKLIGFDCPEKEYYLTFTDGSIVISSLKGLVHVYSDWIKEKELQNQSNYYRFSNKFLLHIINNYLHIQYTFQTQTNTSIQNN